MYETSIYCKLEELIVTDLKKTFNESFLDENIKRKVESLAEEYAKNKIIELWNQSFNAAVNKELSDLVANNGHSNSSDHSSFSETKSNEVKVETKVIDSTQSIFELDKIFMSIMVDNIASIVKLAKDSSEYILDLSSNYLNDNTKSALEEFYNLYFANNSKVQEESTSINNEIDSMIDQLQNLQSQGVTLNDDSLEESEEKKLYRLSISGIQKKLESIISMDADIKKKIHPILNSMQFEDSISQRLSHVKRIWVNVIENESEFSSNPEEVAKKMAKYLTSVDETADYYKIVLKEDPPDETTAAKTINDIFF